MHPFEPDFEIIKMDAEIGSYQEDFEPEPRDSDARGRRTEDEPSAADG
jgi:hypothetical protein